MAVSITLISNIIFLLGILPLIKDPLKTSDTNQEQVEKTNMIKSEENAMRAS